MKYFIDFEFIEGFNKPLFGKRRHFIDMISVGIACEDGRNYYQISSEYNFNDADQWVKENVIIPMYSKTVSGDSKNRWSADTFHKHFGLPNKMIAEDIKKFCSYPIDKDNKDGSHTVTIQGYPEFYGYYSDYDWVLLCSLFGRMIDLPKGFPMYCNDLKQSLDEAAKNLTQLQASFFIVDSANPSWELTSEIPTKIIDIKDWTFEQKLQMIKSHKDYPKQSNDHNALLDAKFNLDLYNFIQTL